MPITALTLPSIITGKKLSLPTFSIDNTGDHDTAALIQRIVDELCSACTREQYVNSGVEDAARRFMLFLNDGGDIVFAQGGDDIMFGDASLDAVAGWLELSGGYLTSVNMAVKIGAMGVAQQYLDTFLTAQLLLVAALNA